ncbi:aminoacyl-histidine dipeptidase [Flagellimonas sp.]|uniref:aminoacyl-histidine dipeptidase n=1 Tax=Flagellimonas sp. TaxID=2058762 RepID=UPI003B5229E6
MTVRELEPNIVWRYFEAINAIPRASTKEEEISAFMVAFGNSLGLETSMDQIGNVIIRKAGSSGRENCKTVVLQAHLDMVHQKETGSTFDFDTQGIQMYIEGDWVKAKDTTLGADNGIGVSAIMAVLASDALEHPPIEALFTIDEEKGMTGAMALTKNQLRGEFLLNLDSEEDDEITIGCAGGVDVEIRGSYQTKILDAKEYELHQIKLGSLKGGHSGVDIHLGSANAILVMSELLNNLISKVDCRLHSVSIGALTNVIPRNGMAIMAVREDKLSSFELEFLAAAERIKRDYQLTDPFMSIDKVKVNRSTGIMDVNTQNQLISALLKLPNGVYSMTRGLDDLVQTSSNIAVLNIEDGSYEIKCHTRSSVNSERDEMVASIQECFPFAQVSEIGPYPGWEPKPDSELLAIAKACYEDLNGVVPNVKSIHAGLECGVIAGMYPKMQMISFGPNILGAHSPEERVQVTSVKKFWKFLVKLLQTLE